MRRGRSIRASCESAREVIVNIAIVGRGKVGTALERGLKRGGHQVVTAGRDRDSIHKAAIGADVIILAVPYRVLDDVLPTLGDAVIGKVLVDATNVMTTDYNMAVGFTTSGAEELQKKVPDARVVKAFNTVFAKHMDTGHLKGEQLSAFVAGDDADAKKTVLDLAREIGFDPIDAGPLRNARLLEPMGYQAIQLGNFLAMGPDIGLKLVH